MECPGDIQGAATETEEGQMQVEEEPLQWWQEASVYQVLLQSFKDSNGDGRGDILGLTNKLDYFVELGIDILWVSPIFDSPMYDMGYDIRDFLKVNPTFGTLEQVDNLVTEAHRRGLKLILDIAFNHTSIEHEWFQTSRANRRKENGEKRDWYIWQEGVIDANGKRKPPNNWESAFGGSAWTWDEVAGAYYMHIFGDKQADLNWENEELRQAIYKIAIWWLERGIDGFRLDCMNLISKAPGFPDAPIINPETELQQANCCFANGPKVHQHLQELHDNVFSKYDIVTIGEMSCGCTPTQAVEYVSRYKPKPEIDLLIQFQHVELDCYDGDKWLLREWELPELKRISTEWQEMMQHCGGWMTLWMENHDQPRGISRFTTSNLRFRTICAKLLAVWLFTLRGTPFIYQGQELGMINPNEFNEEMNQDVETIMYWNAVSGSDDVVISQAKKAILQKGRDNTRVPIPWSDGPNVGFTDEGVKPWLPLCPGSETWHVQNQLETADSVLSWYRKIVRLRKEHPTLLRGTYECIDIDNLYTFTYLRQYRDSCCLIILNFSANASSWSCSDKRVSLAESKMILSNYDSEARVLKQPFVLRPYEALIYELQRYQSDEQPSKDSQAGRSRSF